MLNYCAILPAVTKWVFSFLLGCELPKARDYVKFIFKFASPASSRQWMCSIPGWCLGFWMSAAAVLCCMEAIFTAAHDWLLAHFDIIPNFLLCSSLSYPSSLLALIPFAAPFIINSVSLGWLHHPIDWIRLLILYLTPFPWRTEWKRKWNHLFESLLDIQGSTPTSEGFPEKEDRQSKWRVI